MHDVNPYEYIKHVLICTQVPSFTWDDLMPGNWAKAHEVHA